MPILPYMPRLRAEKDATARSAVARMGARDGVSVRAKRCARRARARPARASCPPMKRDMVEAATTDAHREAIR